LYCTYLILREYLADFKLLQLQQDPHPRPSSSFTVTKRGKYSSLCPLDQQERNEFLLLTRYGEAYINEDLME